MRIVVRAVGVGDAPAVVWPEGWPVPSVGDAICLNLELL